MPDPRFYETKNEIALRTIGARFSISVPESFSEKTINAVNSLDMAQNNELSFCENAPLNEQISTHAGAVLIKPKFADLLTKDSVALICDAPRRLFATIAQEVLCQRESALNTAPEYVERNVRISANCYFGSGTEIGENTFISPNVTIGIGVTIGRNCKIGPGVSIECAHIGDNVIIGANSVIGKAGFGIVLGEKPLDVPHFGRVIIQDNVTIGALCAIDRGVFGDTIIGMNSKLDNHCHVAHNVKMGQGVVIAAFGGISGSVEIGDFVIMGGRVGIADHVKIGDKAILSAGTIVSKDVPNGENWAGYPAKPKIQWLKELVRLEKLGNQKK